MKKIYIIGCLSWLKVRSFCLGEMTKLLRDELFKKVINGELSIQDADKKMRRISRLTQVDTLNKIANIFGLKVGFVKN